MKTGLVILNYNSTDMVLELVRQVAIYQAVADIVVVDNCSHEDEYARLTEAVHIAPHVHLIRAEANRGYAAGNNLGLHYLIEECHADIVAIANPDVTFPEELVTAIAETFTTQPEYGMLSGWCLDTDGQPYPHFYWRPPSYSECVLFLATNGRWHAKNPYQPTSPLFNVGAIGGCLMFIRSTALLDCDYLDEHTFLFFEEDILCSQMHERGWQMGILRDISFTHNHQQSTTEASPPRWIGRLMEESRRYYARTILNASPAQITLLQALYYWALLLHYCYMPFKPWWQKLKRNVRKLAHAI